MRHSKATYGNRFPLITIAFDCNCPVFSHSPFEPRFGPTEWPIASSIRDYSGWMMQASLGYPQRVRIDRVYSEIELRITDYANSKTDRTVHSGASIGARSLSDCR